MKAVVILGTLALLVTLPTLHAQSASDSSDIRLAAVDYIEGWYAGDAPRMERALHPELAKRIVRTDSTSSESRISQMSALSLVQGNGLDRLSASREMERAVGHSERPVGAEASG